LRAPTQAQTESSLVSDVWIPRTERNFITDQVLGNRSLMIQLATFALLLGLFILMRK
jgi:hypothetical protein